MSTPGSAQLNTTDRRGDPAALLNLLAAQRSLVERLDSLAQSQAEMIKEGHIERLLSLLAERQAIIDELTASQTHLGEMMPQGNDSAARLTADQREHIRAAVREIGDRLNAVMERDAQDQAMLRAGREQVKQELSTLGTARKARGAYQGSQQRSARFSDQHG
jgi:hypothetical protein